MLKSIKTTLAQLKKAKPLVLCLTNHVTMDLMANCLLAIGAAPAMSSYESELEELIKISSAVNLNIGTLSAAFVEQCTLAAKFAKYHKKPIVLDPVAVGASSIRTQSARLLMSSADIIRGNASEIMGLSQDGHKAHGVETMHTTHDASILAHNLAATLKCTVVVSGKEDLITDGSRQISLKYGSPLMPKVIGMGCTLTAVIAAFRTVIADPFEAATQATAYFSLCGNLAATKSDNPGTFRTAFIDELYAADLEAMRRFYV